MKSLAFVRFKCVLLGSHEYQSTDENANHLISTIHFDLEIGDRVLSGLQAELKQPYGTDFESEPVEVTRPTGYRGPWNQGGFQEVCEQYYRNCVGKQGRILRLGGNNRLKNFRIGIEGVVGVFPVEAEASGAW